MVCQVRAASIEAIRDMRESFEGNERIESRERRIKRDYRGQGGNTGRRCSNYLLINARGTGETPYTVSKPFIDVNGQILQQLQGGGSYNVDYPAAITQNSEQGSNDILNKVSSTLRQNPNMCFFLEGYSQGAAAVINALQQLSPFYDAIRGIAVVGNPKATTGVESILDLDILFKWLKSSPFSCKTLDICALGDPICGLPTGTSGGLGHFSYTFDQETHSRVIDFAMQALTSGIAACSGVNPNSNNPGIGNEIGKGLGNAGSNLLSVATSPLKALSLGAKRDDVPRSLKRAKLNRMDPQF